MANQLTRERIASAVEYALQRRFQEAEFLLKGLSEEDFVPALLAADWLFRAVRDRQVKHAERALGEERNN